MFFDQVYTLLRVTGMLPILAGVAFVAAGLRVIRHFWGKRCPACGRLVTYGENLGVVYTICKCGKVEVLE